MTDDETPNEYTSDDMGDFASRFWQAVKEVDASSYPTKIPENMSREEFKAAEEDLVESGDAESYSDAAEMLRVPDDEKAEEQAEDLFDFLDRSWRDTVIVVPPWWANDDMGEWGSVWVGSSEGLTQSGKALKVEDLIRYKDRNEDSYFRTEVDFNTIPLSLLEFSATVTKPEPDNDLLIEAAGDNYKMWRGKLSEADFAFRFVDTHDRRPRVAVDFPAPWESDEAEAMKDDFDALDWVVEDDDGEDDHESPLSTHKDFDKRQEVWFVDEKSLDHVITFLANQDWTIGVARQVENRNNPLTEEQKPQEPDSPLWDSDNDWPAPED